MSDSVQTHDAVNATWASPSRPRARRRWNTLELRMLALALAIALSLSLLSPHFLTRTNLSTCSTSRSSSGWSRSA